MANNQPLYNVDETINDNPILKRSRKSMGDKNSSMYKNIDTYAYCNDKQRRLYSYNDLLRKNSYLRRCNSYLQSRVKSRIERVEILTKECSELKKEINKYKQENIQLKNYNNELDSMHNGALNKVIDLRKQLRASDILSSKLNANSIPKV